MPDLVPVDIARAFARESQGGLVTPQTSAWSGEAWDLARAVLSLREQSERSQELFGRKAEALSDLVGMVRSCSTPDWDGQGAIALYAASVARAQDFIRALPEDLEMPEFAPEPDGSVSLDWMPSRLRRFSVSVGPTDRLVFAWMDGTDSGHGVARFDGERIPARVLDGIRATLGHGDPAFRAA